MGEHQAKLRQNRFRGPPEERPHPLQTLPNREYWRGDHYSIAEHVSDVRNEHKTFGRILRPFKGCASKHPEGKKAILDIIVSSELVSYGLSEWLCSPLNRPSGVDWRGAPQKKLSKAAKKIELKETYSFWDNFCTSLFGVLERSPKSLSFFSQV